MNEVNIVKPLLQHAAGATSSHKAIDTQKVDNVRHSVASSDDTEKVSQIDAVPVQRLQAEVAKVNNFVQNVQRDLQFSVDEDADKTVIRVVDSDSGELIRQIPEDIFLELARRLNESGEVSLLNAVG